MIIFENVIAEIMVMFETISLMVHYAIKLNK